MTLSGKDRDGGTFGTFLLDATAGGGGAFIDHDGLNGSGDHCVPRPSIANVESSEAGGPFLYLYRSFVPDTGGPGRTRGGTSTSVAIVPYETDGINAMLVGHGIEVPNSTGQSGGLPGSCGRNFVRRDAGDSHTIVGWAGAAIASGHPRGADRTRPGITDLQLGCADTASCRHHRRPERQPARSQPTSIVIPR